MKRYQVKVKGIRPLLHKRYPMEDFTGSKGRRSTVFDAEAEVEKCFYRDDKGNIVQPTNHFEGAIVKGATQIQFKGKKTFKDLAAQGLLIVDDYIPFTSDSNDYEVDIMTAVNKTTRGRMPIARPKWNNWEFDFTLVSNVEDHINLGTLKNILDEAGKIGIGTYRMKYGQFEVVSVEEIS